MTPKQLRARDLYLQRTYGITLAQYDELLAAQGGVCAICANPPKPGKNLNVDHDHKSQVVRGLLCWHCNHKVLPPSRDNPSILARAAEYLISPPAVRWLGRIVAPAKPKRRRRKKSTPKS